MLREYEVEVSDFDTMQALLTRLGFVVTLRYEKYRETFVYDGAKLLLDEVPFGAFLEIEGPRDAIRAVATKLGLDFAARLTASYGEIFDAVCSHYCLPCTDLTFAQFQGVHVDLRACQLT
ncbi:MAG: hypothetical protein KatS3mg131_0526 [Candidatus Tectimicrobiota bacterium]|nr:MAG: hypothetical protein KatS3mg131_0526 [Candidatus Tectomicrobia bacterium]